ncbi:MAG: phosphoribosylaminoimidazolesuccinocarboxamide synthase [Clostridiales bacterium]|jgi:phosphoribosylaminoimidazole-succinocarboxamide synthase|nr:phosphoribosylaminoimidazolesuccinocarboxamide synthase [Clostridiales bacterium]
MEKRELLYSGKAKEIYSTDEPCLVIMKYLDDLTALNGAKHGSFADKGHLNRQISDKIFVYLERRGIKTHYVKTINSQEVLVKKVSIIPLEVIVRNIAAGSFSKKYGVPEGTPLACSVLEFSYKNDELGDPMLSESHALALGLATKRQIETISKVALLINDELKALFDNINLRLIDFKIEFGIDNDGNILLADEISPDSCRLWDKDTDKKLDKDRFRLDLGDVEAAYRDVASRLT